VKFFKSLQIHNTNFTKIGNIIKNKEPNLIPAIALHLENRGEEEKETEGNEDVNQFTCRNGYFTVVELFS
jgi:hypothetical protein